MGKLKTAKGFMIASLVCTCIGLLVALLMFGLFSVTTDVIKELIISKGGSTAVGKEGIISLFTDLEKLEAMANVDSSNLETLDLVSLELIYQYIYAFNQLFLIAVISTIIGLVLTIVAISLISKAPRTKKLTGAIVVSFVSVLFCGLFSLISAIILATIHKDELAE